MFTIFKWAIILLVALLVVCAAGHDHCRAIVCEKTLEGLGCGLLVSLVLAFSRLDRLRHPERFTIPEMMCLVRHELCAGFVGGLLLGLLFALVFLLRG